MFNQLAEKKLYRVPEEGKIKGVCAGLAHYFNIPVKLIRVMVVLSLFFGLFVFTFFAYIALAFMLPVAPASRFVADATFTPRQLLAQVDHELNAAEKGLRDVERYVTSETFGVQNRFRQL